MNMLCPSVRLVGQLISDRPAGRPAAGSLNDPPDATYLGQTCRGVLILARALIWAGWGPEVGKIRTTRWTCACGWREDVQAVEECAIEWARLEPLSGLSISGAHLLRSRLADLLSRLLGLLWLSSAGLGELRGGVCALHRWLSEKQ